jgi:enoyl-[acyl-carrier protein] reductase II
MKTLDEIWQRGKDFLGVRYPLICGAMTWVSDYELIKASGQTGIFPVLAGGNMPPDLFEAEVDKCIQNIDTPFAVNLITIAPNYNVHREILERKDVSTVVFAGSIPKASAIKQMKEAGKKTMAFASTESIADQMIRFGADALILEGSEAGGHIGHVSLTILLQQVLFKFREVPIFVGGGIASGNIMAHLLLMGAAGCQLGTRFVMTDECTAHPKFKEAFIKAKAREAVATPQYDSKLPVVAVRAIKNAGMENFGRLQLELLQKLNGDEISREEAQYEVERYWVGSLRKAVVDGDVDDGSLMAGQSVGLMHDVKPMREVVAELVSEAESEIERIKRVLI